VYLLYSFVTLLTLVALSPYFLYQALRHNKYIGSLGQRLGYLPVSLNLDGDDSIWVHAVSVGEVLAARPLVPALRARFPSHRIFLSTTTVTGNEVAT
jgi:3-deoxy-D-manno-octulosonic-acid transferase